MLNLVVLGSGTAVPHARRASTAYWLETGRGSSILLDPSAAAPHRMAQEGLDWANLDAVWVSHFHLDHVGGLAPFLFGTKNAPQTRERRKPLLIYGGSIRRGRQLQTHAAALPCRDTRSRAPHRFRASAGHSRSNFFDAAHARKPRPAFDG
jgi:ribonuclease BN (tRNA processing enzyme)